MEDDKLLELEFIRLRDRNSTFEIYQLINFPIPYLREEHCYILPFDRPVSLWVLK